MIIAGFRAVQMLSAAAQTEMSDGDIIMRTLVGMAFIMTLMFLAVIVTGKIGQMHRRRTGTQEQDSAPADAPAEDSSEDTSQD